MTIVDSSYAIMEGFNYVARHEGLPEVSHELTMKYIATPLPTFCEGLLGDYRPEWIRLYRSQSERLERELIRPFPDTVPALQRLHDMGIKLAVLSNREYPHAVLEHTGLISLFDAVIGARELPDRSPANLPYKPDPGMLQCLMDYMHVSPADTVYVGDADIDMATALGAHVRAVGITAGNFSHDDFRHLGAWKSIDTLTELVRIAQLDNA